MLHGSNLVAALELFWGHPGLDLSVVVHLVVIVQLGSEE